MEEIRYLNLWTAVVSRAMLDLTGKTSLKAKNEALEFFKSEDFEYICKISELDSEQIINGINRNTKGGLGL